VTPGILPSALRASLRLFKIAPGDFVSLPAGVAARADERKKLERLCRYISRPAVSEKRLSLTPNGNIRYLLKTPYRESLPRERSECCGYGTTHVIFEPLDLMAHIPVRHPAGDLRSSKSAILPICHCPPGGAGAQTARQSDPPMQISA